MRQAIEEKFILDVVTNYTTYKTYYRLVKAIEDDPNLPKKKGARALGVRAKCSDDQTCSPGSTKRIGPAFLTPEFPNQR